MKRPSHADFDAEREPPVVLATRLPKQLHRKLKLHCVVHEITIMDFVIQAIREKLAREGGRQRGRGE